MKLHVSVIVKSIIVLMSFGNFSWTLFGQNEHTEGIAVLIIDMQDGFYDRGGVRGTAELEELVLKQLQLIDWASSNRVPIMFLEYKGFGKTDTRLLEHLNKNEFRTYKKFRDTAFSSRWVEKKLREWNVDTLLVAGVNGEYCVKETVFSALDRGYEVYSSADTVGNINRYPAIYPDRNWFFEHEHFFGFNDLEVMLDFALGYSYGRLVNTLD